MGERENLKGKDSPPPGSGGGWKLLSILCVPVFAFNLSSEGGPGRANLFVCSPPIISAVQTGTLPGADGELQAKSPLPGF